MLRQESDETTPQAQLAAHLVSLSRWSCLADSTGYNSFCASTHFLCIGELEVRHITFQVMQKIPSFLNRFACIN